MSPVALFLAGKTEEAIASMAAQGVKRPRGMVGWDVDEARIINEEHLPYALRKPPCAGEAASIVSAAGADAQHAVQD